MKLLWLTDIHLNFLNEEKRTQFYQSIKQQGDIVVISGDIAEGNSVVKILEEMAHYLNKPIYFVLGNHDYYYGHINHVRHSMRLLTDSHSLLFWLGSCAPIKLDDDTILIGEDGWADGRYGNYADSTAIVNDNRLIVDLFQARMLGRNQLLEKMQQLADEDAIRLYDKLQMAAAANPKKIIVITHVPPFKESTLHEGKFTDDDFLPFFSSKATGDVLIKFSKECALEIMVLCGHTHDPCTYHPLNNLTVEVGKAEYYQPCIQGVIETQTLNMNIDLR